MSQAPAGNDDEDFDRFENEASKVFALWEIMGTAPPGAPAAAAPAVESALDALEAAALQFKEPGFEAASTAQDMPAVAQPAKAEPEVWATDAGKTTIDGRALPRMEEPLPAAAPIVTAAAFAPTVEAPIGAFAADASLPDVTQAHAALPPIAAVAPPQTRPAEMVAPQVKIPSQPPSDMFASPAAAPLNKTVVFGSQTGPIAKNAEQPLQVQQFPDQTIRAEAIEGLPQRGMGMVWIGVAATVLLAATGGLIWMASGSTETPPTAPVVAAEESRPVPLPSGLPPSATATPVVAAPVVAAPVEAPAVAAPVVAAPVVAAPVVEAPAPVPVVAAPVAAPVVATPVARPAAAPVLATRVEPAREEPRRMPSTIRRRVASTTSMQSAGTSMRPTTLMGDNPYK
jgi:hypothetical protein